MKAGRNCYWVLHENGKIGYCCFQVYGDWEEKFFVHTVWCSEKVASEI